MFLSKIPLPNDTSRTQRATIHAPCYYDSDDFKDDFHYDEEEEDQNDEQPSFDEMFADQIEGLEHTLEELRLAIQNCESESIDDVDNSDNVAAEERDENEDENAEEDCSDPTMRNDRVLDVDSFSESSRTSGGSVTYEGDVDRSLSTDGSKCLDSETDRESRDKVHELVRDRSFSRRSVSNRLKNIKTEDLDAILSIRDTTDSTRRDRSLNIFTGLEEVEEENDDDAESTLIPLHTNLMIESNWCGMFQPNCLLEVLEDDFCIANDGNTSGVELEDFCRPTTPEIPPVDNQEHDVFEVEPLDIKHHFKTSMLHLLPWKLNLDTTLDEQDYNFTPSFLSWEEKQVTRLPPGSRYDIEPNFETGLNLSSSTVSESFDFESTIGGSETGFEGTFMGSPRSSVFRNEKFEAIVFEKMNKQEILSASSSEEEGEVEHLPDKYETEVSQSTSDLSFGNEVHGPSPLAEFNALSQHNRSVDYEGTTAQTNPSSQGETHIDGEKSSTTGEDVVGADDPENDATETVSKNFDAAEIDKYLAYLSPKMPSDCPLQEREREESRDRNPLTSVAANISSATGGENSPDDLHMATKSKIQDRCQQDENFDSSRIFSNVERRDDEDQLQQKLDVHQKLHLDDVASLYEGESEPEPSASFEDSEFGESLIDFDFLEQNIKDFLHAN